jgi:hypothetical protein
MDREIQLETLRDHGAIPRRSPPLPRDSAGVASRCSH